MSSIATTPRVVAVSCKTDPKSLGHLFVVRVTWDDGREEVVARGEAWVASKAAAIEREWGLVDYAYGKELLAA